MTCLKNDGINVLDIVNFKQYTVVDIERPKLCADRLDGVILTGIGWTKNISLDEIKLIIDNLKIFKNEDGENEIGFTSLDILKRVVEISKTIDLYCHSKEDNYMMELLAGITKLVITKGYVDYDDLYYYDEEELFEILKSFDDKEVISLLDKFENIKLGDIPNIKLSNVKIRKLSPLFNNKRMM